MFPGKSQGGSGKGQKKMKTLFFSKSKNEKVLKQAEGSCQSISLRRLSSGLVVVVVGDGIFFFSSPLAGQVRLFKVIILCYLIVGKVGSSASRRAMEEAGRRRLAGVRTWPSISSSFSHISSSPRGPVLRIFCAYGHAFLPEAARQAVHWRRRRSGLGLALHDEGGECVGP